MRERLPLTPRGTEPTAPAMLVTSLHLQGAERGPTPAAPPRDPTEVVPRMPLAPLALPLLLMQVQKRCRHDFRIELGRRDGLRRHADLGGRLALRHAQGVVDD